MGGDVPDVHIERTPLQLVLLLASTLLCTCYCLVGGSLYVFPSFSVALQYYGYSHVALLGSVGNIGMFAMGYFAGLAIDFFGQKAVAAAGVLLLFSGYMLLRATVQVVDGMSEGVVAFALLTIGTGAVATLMSMLTYQQALYSAKNRGKITALLLGAYCLSGAVWAPIYDAQFPQPQQFGDYCLTIGLVALILGIVMVACTGELINPCKRHKPALPAVEPQPAGASTAAAAAPADASSRAWDAMEPATSAKRIEDEAAALGVPAAFLAQQLEPSGASKAGATATPTPAAVVAPPTDDDGPPATVFTVVLCLSPLSLRFWLLWLPVFVVLGSAFVLVNNTALIVDAYQDPAGASSVIQQLTVVFGICNAASRIGGGWVTDLLAARRLSRLWLLVVACFLAILGCMVLSLGGADGVQAGNVLLGIADGFCFAVWPVQTRETFGKKRYGRFYGLTNVAVGAGSVAFNAMASSLYHNVGHTIVSDDGVVQFVCSGGSCFQGAFGVAAALCVVVALIPTAVLLWVSTAVPMGAAKESLALQDAMLSANAFDSQLEIDLDMIRADEHTDSGFNEVASRMRGMVMRRQPSLAGSADVTNSAP